MSALRPLAQLKSRRACLRFFVKAVKSPTHAFAVKNSLLVERNAKLRLTPSPRNSHLFSSTPGSSSMSKSDSRLSSQSDCDGETGLSSVDSAYAEIVVVRHGETASNADGIIQGQLDVELNDSGRQQAVVVADRLSKEPRISAIYSSDLKRAYETAQKIATSCGELEINKDPGLRERNLGDLQGLPRRELANLNPKAYEAFVSHRTDQEIPGGGESLDQLYERSTSSVQRIGRKHKGERVVVVTHGGVIGSLYKRANPNGRAGGKVLNTSVNIFHLYDGDKWVIKTWCDVSHLQQTAYLESGSGADSDVGLDELSYALADELRYSGINYLFMFSAFYPKNEFNVHFVECKWWKKWWKNTVMVPGRCLSEEEFLQIVVSTRILLKEAK